VRERDQARADADDRSAVGRNCDDHEDGPGDPEENRYAAGPTPVDLSEALAKSHCCLSAA
jgi:hypothetical protein